MEAKLVVLYTILNRLDNLRRSWIAREPMIVITWNVQISLRL